MAFPARDRERSMKREEVILRMLSKQLTFWQAAYRRCGFDGLYAAGGEPGATP